MEFGFILTVSFFVFSCFMDRDIEMIAGSGCPSTDRKVVNSGKRLRAHLGIDEGNVCTNLFFLMFDDNRLQWPCS
ncbi:hypothetical protein HanOQP8_Chr17g0679021 [Helianthus annuus]|nr:hypothetical protein HanOQP8_Chr17g0679021 [Helianthus annuus]